MKEKERGSVSAQRLLIQIRLPEEHWAGIFTRTHPGLVLRVVEHMPLPKGRGSVLVEIIGLDSAIIRDTLNEINSIDEYTILDEFDTGVEALLHIGKGGGGFLRPLMESEAVPKTPFEVLDGWVEWDLIVNQAHARVLVTKLKEGDVTHRIIGFGNTTNHRLLTVRQREVFDRAVREGYYESPRRITLTALAEMLSVSKSTLCEMIHLIEKHIIEEFADNIRHQSPKERSIGEK
jgi:hypothetical protein